MRVRAKDKLTKSKRNKGHTMNNIGILGENPSLVRLLRVTTYPLPQLGLHGFLLNGKFNIA